MLYDYVCLHCGHSQEASHSMNDSPEVICKVCGKQMVKKISNCNFILKGGGWPGKEISRKDESFKKQVEREKQEGIKGPEDLPRSG